MLVLEESIDGPFAKKRFCFPGLPYCFLQIFIDIPLSQEHIFSCLSVAGLKRIGCIKYFSLLLVSSMFFVVWSAFVVDSKQKEREDKSLRFVVLIPSLASSLS